ncbi:MAG: FkbM family methyltransferase [Vicingaceae bacterium]
MMLHKINRILPHFIQRLVRMKYYEYKFKKAGVSDEMEIGVLSTIIESGSTVLDIGANYGLYTKFLSKFTGTTGMVHSFEPVAKTFDVLKNNVSKFKLTNVRLHNLALSDAVGFAKMSIPQYEKGGENLYEAHISNDGTGEEVVTNTIDNVMKDEVVHFIKCDAEGHDLAVLRGAINLLERDHPMLMLEINGGINSNEPDIKALLDYLYEFNYEAFIPNNKLLIKPIEEYRGVNFFFLNADHIEKLSDKVRI